MEVNRGAGSRGRGAAGAHATPTLNEGGNGSQLCSDVVELLRLIFFVICIFKHIWKHADQIFFWMLHCVRLSCWQSVTTWTTLLTTVFIMIILTIMMNSYRSEQNRNKTYFRQGQMYSLTRISELWWRAGSQVRNRALLEFSSISMYCCSRLLVTLSAGVDIKSRWRHNWKSAQVVNSHLVCDPTIWQPGFNLPRQQWSLLNRFRTEQGHCGAWRLTDTDLCPCGETQTMSHIVESCPLTKLNGGLSRMHSAVLWLTDCG